jgi:hypothetical protein
MSIIKAQYPAPEEYRKRKVALISGITGQDGFVCSISSRFSIRCRAHVLTCSSLFSFVRCVYGWMLG